MSYPAVLVSIAGAGLAAGLQFALRAVMARFMGQDGYGELSVGLALCAVLSALCGLGMMSYLARGLAYRLGLGDVGAAKRVAGLSILVPMTASTITALLLFAFADPLSGLFKGGPGFPGTLRVLCLVVPGLVGISLLEAFGRGLQKVWYYVGIGGVLPAAVRLITVVGVVAVGIVGAPQLATSYLLASAAALVIGVLVMRKDVRRIFAVPGWGVRDPGMIRFSVGAFGAQALGIARARSDTLLMGMLMSMGQVGLYSAALSIAALVPLGLSSVNQVLMPRLAGEYARGEIEGMRDVYQGAAIATLCITLPLLLALLLGAEEMVTVLFGQAYAPASLALKILVVGYFVNAVAGSFGAAFVAVGEPGWSMFVTVVGVASSIGSLLVLVPKHGLVGAATAMTISFVLSALVGVAITAYRLKLVPWSLQQAKFGLVVIAVFGLAHLTMRSASPVADVTLLPVRVLATYAMAAWLAVRMKLITPADRSAFMAEAARMLRRPGKPSGASP